MEETGISVVVAEDPLTLRWRGGGKALEMIGYARRRPVQRRVIGYRQGDGLITLPTLIREYANL